MGDFKPLNCVVIVQPNSFYNEISRRASNGATELALGIRYSIRNYRLWGEAAPKEADVFFSAKIFGNMAWQGEIPMLS